MTYVPNMINICPNNKDRKQSSSSQFESQDKGKKDVRDGGRYTFSSRRKFFGC